jgi:hypothetical protein
LPRVEGQAAAHTVILPRSMRRKSAFTARRLRGGAAGAGDRILLNFNMDMVSRGKNDVLWAVGTGRHPALRSVLEAAARGAKVTLRLGHDQEGTGPEDWTLLSDHGPFHQAGIPFVYFGVDDHPDYHKPGRRCGADRCRLLPAIGGDHQLGLTRLDARGAVLDRARREAKAVGK